jgi:DNA oxidative demethylase
MFEIVFTLSLAEQQKLVQVCRTLIQQAPLFQKVMPTGAKFNYLCTSAGIAGWLSDQRGYRYAQQHPVTGQAFPPIPPEIEAIAQRAVAHYGLTIRAETALINWYSLNSTLGLHQDKTEISRAPVVSISLGDDCVFIRGGVQRTDPKDKLILKSGDVLVMGAEHRLAYHGVKKILPNTAPAELGLKQPGRINITIRQIDD